MNEVLAHVALRAVPLALVALSAAAASAQGAISTDRPGLGFSAATVPAGAYQVELGLPAVGLSSSGDGDARLINVPVLLRVGVTRSLELRAGSTLLNRSRMDAGGVTETSDGWGPLELGVKYGASLEGGPALALIPSVVIPLDEGFSGDRAAWTVNGVASWALPADLGLTTVAGLTANPAGEDDFTTSYALVGVLGRGVAERASAFVEAGLYPTPGAADPAYAGGGVTWLLTDALQMDAFADVGLNDAATDVLVGVGVAVRF